jgi:hypothetical protein
MKQLKMIFGLLIIITVIISCSKTDYQESKDYSDFLNVELSSINNSLDDSVFLVKITNSINQEFEQVCVLDYELINKLSNEVFFSHEYVFNKKVPNSPILGYLNLQSGGDYNHVINLNNIGWDNQYYSDLESGDYNLVVSLYIQDPESPKNKVSSNILVIKK